MSAEEKAKEGSTSEDQTSVPGYWKRVFYQGHLVTFAKYCPLATAILAPLSTLMDIPALSQRWYLRDGSTQPDPTASLALSAVGLLLNVIANILLVLRFSSRSQKWVKHTVHWSLACWIAKTVVAAINLIWFGIYHRQGGSEGYTYAEGFWCAVVSIVVAGLISLALLVHFLLAYGKQGADEASVRLSGRKFMLSVTAFMSIIALQALVYSRLEHWSYADGIYFSIQTAFTIGYGDLTPTTPATKALIFPFAILTISQLGNEISLIVAFIRERSHERRRVWRRQYEGAIHREARLLRPNATLVEEMRLVHDINKREEWASQMIDLFWSAVSLIMFWLIGALIFAKIEGWNYGDGVYAVIVTSLTIGTLAPREGERFGDYTPVQPAGRVYFIPFALLAVPIVTSFAVQTITGLLSTFSNRGHTTEVIKRMREQGSRVCRPHEELVEEHRRANTHSRDTPSSSSADKAKSDEDDERTELARRLMQTVTAFEAQARQLLLDNLDHSLARTLLVADRNLQDRSGAPPGQKGHASAETTMAEVERYRSLFAEVLVLGSMVQGLDGEEQATFERRSTSTSTDRPTLSQSPLSMVDPKLPASAGGAEVTHDQASASWVDGLRGLSKIMYRQHTRQLKRAYSVA